MAKITVLHLMDMIEQDESIRNYQSRWRELRSLLEKQAEVASQQSVQADEFSGHANNCVLRSGGYACTCGAAETTRR